MIVITLAVITLLVFINGLYVAAEFAAVSVQRARLATAADDGNGLARYLLDVVESPRRLDAYIAACQLGITVSSLLLGYYGRGQIYAIIEPMLRGPDGAVSAAANTISTTVILMGLTIFQVVLGELIPKNVALQYPERLGLATAVPMRWSLRIFRPLIAIFNGSGAFILRLFGQSAVAEHAHMHSPEEIQLLVQESSKGGVLEPSESSLLVNTLKLRDMTAERVMIPRGRMVMADADLPVDEVLRYLAASPYSRLPLYEGDADHIVGVAHIKDLLCAVRQPGSESTQPAREVMHAVDFVPEFKPVDEVLQQMQRTHHNMVMVVDEHGGVAGLITVEDLIEEIIGEFHDEFDTNQPAFRLVEGERLYVRGDVQVEELNERMDMDFASETSNSIGGLVMDAVGRIPTEGERIAVDEHFVRVEQMEGNRVAEVSIEITPEQLEQFEETA